MFIPGSIPIRVSRVFIFWAASADTMLKCRGSREMQWTCGTPPEDLTVPFSRSVMNVQSGERVKAKGAPKMNEKTSVKCYYSNVTNYRHDKISKSHLMQQSLYLMTF